MPYTSPFPCPDLQQNRLRPDHLLGAADHLIGFHPRDSLLVVFLGREKEITVTARVDWDLCRTDPVHCAEALAARGHNTRAVAAFVAAVDPEHEDREALAAVRDRLESLYFEVIWTGQLRGDVWRGLLCDDADCPEHRVDRDTPSALLTTMVSHGSAPVPDRSAIVAEVARDEVGVVSLAEISAVLPHGDVEQWRDETLAYVMDLLAENPPLTGRDVAMLCAACRDIRVRDVVLWRLTVGPEHLCIGWHRAWRVFAAALRRSPVSHVAPVGAVAALVAWQMGQGARALECLQRVPEGDANHSLAGLVLQCVDAGLPPTLWQTVMASMDEQTCRHGESGSVVDASNSVGYRRRRS